MAITENSELAAILASNPGKLVLYLQDQQFPGHAQLCTVIESLKEDFPGVAFHSIDRNSVKDSLAVTGTPCFVLFDAGKEVNRLEGCSTSMLVTAVRAWNKAPSQETTVDRIKRLITTHPVLLFMKGDKHEPFCRFSRAVVQMLNESGVIFEGYNIFEDPELREELKIYSNWPTYPQLYVKGSLIGGHDIIKELFENNALRDEIPKECLR
ncbi:Glutaredoxin 3 [Babesia sp. Xinjiang]|uniref:Glutaredoxin 3 n=1 Tax=Babesia sp. Xinjiang TaxID=462227 RepID=UPI000A23277F|nr:Glutaredoxin 3 [Babesia sp. Xinjiang]XP_028871440.1 Glutaredoxin 3 [Babesia sp. Xinjiang]ORM40836.1 Glutaredoxin 3 [Babesia sp. Xinjiang]ORM40984.1 Glutaredoxin 3 [Babesia sp. Xinjiang]